MNRRVFALSAIFAAACFAAPADSKPDFSGEWKLNVEKSNFGPMPGPDSETRKIVHKDPEVAVATTQTGGPQGDMTNDFKFTTDGKEATNVIKTPNGEIEIKTIGSWDGKDIKTNNKLNVQGMDISSEERMALSEDGKVLTNTRKISTPQGEFETSMVFEKVTASKPQ
jgi:hypothetical protein